MTDAAPSHYTPQLSPTLVVVGGRALSLVFFVYYITSLSFFFLILFLLRFNEYTRVCLQKIAAQLMMDSPSLYINIKQNQIKMIPGVCIEPDSHRFLVVSAAPEC